MGRGAELTLTSADPDVLPQLRFRYMSEPELQRIRSGGRLVARLLEQPARWRELVGHD
ncbi:hypothetical protein GCM10010121_097410 [Streptomyces brasiliensis]|uniref:Glucose-methanol-choline oxidoreductase C-terminal domain-containing protein n=1 Tax=Streptomyces brasiliensis TaxID=1954 RepID=A0A917PCU8_9ACTN|nr:hypothetical protein GCM10010121_097410 [Streptomyces brasiliensis]